MEDSINEADLTKLLGWCRRGRLQKLQDILETFTGDITPLLGRQLNGRSMMHEAADMKLIGNTNTKGIY